MHYKGKKHAKVMYLKRSRETKQTPQKMSSAAYLSEAISQVQPNCSPSSHDNKLSGLVNEVEHHVIISSNSPGHNSIMLDDTKTVCDNTALQRTPSADGRNENGGEHEETNALSDDNHSGCDQARPHIPVDSLDSSINSNSDEDEVKLVDCTSLPLPCLEDDNKAKISLGIPQREPVVLPDPLPRYISRIEKPAILKESLRCTVCDIYVNSENQMRQHVNSLRHKNIEKGIPTPPKPVKDDKPKGKAEQFRCEVCRVTLNSDIQLLQHLSSQRHKNMLEGRPPKPRWTPYERTQHALLRSAAQLRLSLKTIPGGTSPLLLTSPVSNSATGLPVAGHPALRPSVIAPQAPAHLKQMAYIAPNGSILQTQEIVYIGAPAPVFPRTQHPHQVPAGMLQSTFPAVHSELPHVISPPCVSLDPHALSWNP